MKALAVLCALVCGAVVACGPLPSSPSPSVPPVSEPSTTAVPGPSETATPTAEPVPAPSPTAEPPVITSVPTPSTTAAPPVEPPGRTYPKHTGIVSTTFWVGELFNDNIADGSQVCSAYDSQWAYHWSGGINKGTAGGNTDCADSIVGGCDGKPGAKGTCATEVRTAANDFFPTDPNVHPAENPFYLDLPFDDMNDPTAFKTRCDVIPWAKDDLTHCKDTKNSYMKNRWVKLTGPNGHVCYGQNEDAGPSSGSAYHDSKYVFGSDDARPANAKFGGAGIDVSPALNGCLGYKETDGDGDKVDWEFVDRAAVPPGPWTKVITVSGFSG